MTNENDKRIAISDLELLTKKYSLSHLVLLCYSEKDNIEYVATYGGTLYQSAAAANFGNKLKELLGWPDSLDAQPKRVLELEDKIAQLKQEVFELETALKATTA